MSALAATEYTFTGLSNVEYEIWITANNGYDDSAASTRVNNTPYVAPSAPQNPCR